MCVGVLEYPLRAAPGVRDADAADMKPATKDAETLAVPPPYVELVSPSQSSAPRPAPRATAAASLALLRKRSKTWRLKHEHPPLPC
jgi:hypothetical protein